MYKHYIVMAADHDAVSRDMQKIHFISGFDKLLKLGKEIV